jgi:hypothetical protein
MRQNARLFSLIAALCLLFGSSALLADNSTRIPGYTIHHNALTTDMLPPQIANAYEIRRSKNRAMLNVSVIKEIPGTTGQPVGASVKVVAKNLMGQGRDIPMREIREGEAVYYIGDFLVANREQLRFELEVTPDGERRAHTASLTQEFHTD